MADFIGAFDQSTTATRFAVVGADGAEAGAAAREHDQLRPAENRVEHDPAQIWDHARSVMADALGRAGLAATDLAAIGITNQIETTVVWDRRTGRPYHHAIVWQDTRTDQLAAALAADGRAETIHRKAGLVSNPHFSATKIQWLLEHVPGLRAAAERGDALFGGTDTWLIWQLTGGTAGGRHVTDVTNASRTMLMNLTTLDWDEELLDLFGVPRAMLPRIHSSVSPDGFGTTAQHGVPISGVLGGPQAAMFGNGCSATGAAWCNSTHRNLVMLNIGSEPVRSRHGLHTTVAYQLPDTPAVYALEGNIAHTGDAARWVVEDLGSLSSPEAFETAASSVTATEGLYFVPAFTGLGVPHPEPEARGALIGLAPGHTKAHLARATLESTGFRMHQVLAAMTDDCAVAPLTLTVDGSAAACDVSLAVQADVTGIPVSRAASAEPPTRGAAYAAGLGVGYWKDTGELPVHRPGQDRWKPRWKTGRRRAALADWRRAVARTGPLAGADSQASS
ncbi:FGGY family carbohydrate kinase [Streptomyces iranensis]|uniref:ATP:glycerol 3-phosphotransferase n=1 Tax=Streptomyces iranensis TaxID=576784 RepID=A0A061A5X9_9ACTN|nr:glycerol kinase GlpK [Streptomyces iranensis]MBP2067667.1 glycerol kinase [Streptomyces iranensis]CDR18225.1 Carbohydrate kinase, FGGY [Streptomyces iranensis]